MDTLITNIGQLVTPNGRGPVSGDRMSQLSVHEGVSLRIRDDRILSIGSGGEREDADVVVDADGRLVLPGLVDPHVHFAPPPIPCSAAADVGSRPEAMDELGTRERLVLGRILRNGTTTIEVKCTDAEEIGTVIRRIALMQLLDRQLPIRILPTFLGAPLDGAAPRRADRISEMIRDVIPLVRRQLAAQFCDVVVGSSGYSIDEARTFLRAVRGAGLRLKVHGCGSGDTHAVALASQLEVESVDHLLAPNAVDIRRLHVSGTIPVLLPGHALMNEQPYPHARRMIDGGLPVALGSDYGLSGQGVESMWTVIFLAVAKMGMSPDEAITAATLNAASALGLSAEIGSIEPGKRADVILLDLDSHREIPMCVGRNPVSTVIVAGKVVHAP